MKLPGTPESPPRLTLLAAITYSVLGLYWSVKAVVDAAAGSYGTDFYFGLVLGAAFIVLAVIQWMAWSKARGPRPDRRQ